MYAEKPEFVAGLEDFVRGRPPQPVDAFLHQSEAIGPERGWSLATSK